MSQVLRLGLACLFGLLTVKIDNLVGAILMGVTTLALILSLIIDIYNIFQAVGP
jgi:hypothetical protein